MEITTRLTKLKTITASKKAKSAGSRTISNRIPVGALSSVLALGSLCMVGNSMAQIAPNTLPVPAARVYNSISVDQMAGILGSLGISSRAVPAEGIATRGLAAQVSGGGAFSVRFLGCADKVNGTGCNLILLRTALNNSGVSYQDLNSFNISAIATKAVNLPDRNLVAFLRTSLIRGGVGTEQLQGQVAIFLSDMELYVKTQLGATSVNYDERSSDLSTRKPSDEKISQIGKSAGKDSSPVKISATQVDVSDLADAILLENAITNTRSVRFMNEEIAGFLQ